MGDDFYDAPPAEKSYKKARYFIKISVLDICIEVNYCFFPSESFSDVWKSREYERYDVIKERVFPKYKVAISR
ncbi:MAG: hypothetical protein A2Z38_00785 [Planctomycetes bacterium RBG_19FT_COMBO_48_8]|nr:MAG: hypothetical protein A2Z38_00785 [Planctomycetes bacterium RBG_19FT_COMBO_48_8]